MTRPKRRDALTGLTGASILERTSETVRKLRYRIVKDGKLLAGTTDAAKAAELAELMGAVVETGGRHG
jgi:hypothetical protein